MKTLKNRCERRYEMQKSKCEHKKKKLDLRNRMVCVQCGKDMDIPVII